MALPAHGSGFYNLFDARPCSCQFGLRGCAPDETGADCQNLVQGTARRSSQGTLPDVHYTPAGLQESLFIPLIPEAVALDLAGPEGCPDSWKPEHRTGAAMPEASMHKDHGSWSRKDDIRPPGQT
jgi:hypothetical protein